MKDNCLSTLDVAGSIPVSRSWFQELNAARFSPFPRISTSISDKLQLWVLNGIPSNNSIACRFLLLVRHLIAEENASLDQLLSRSEE